MKDELDEKRITKFPGLRAKTQNYLIDDSNENEKLKDTKLCHKKHLNLKVMKII